MELTAKEENDINYVVDSYGEFWNNIKFRKGWADPPSFTRAEVEHLLKEAAYRVVRIREHLDIMDTSFKIRQVEGSARAFMWEQATHPNEAPEEFIRNIVQHTFQDGTGYVEDLDEYKVNKFMDQLELERHTGLSALKRRLSSTVLKSAVLTNLVNDVAQSGLSSHGQPNSRLALRPNGKLKSNKSGKSTSNKPKKNGKQSMASIMRQLAIEEQHEASKKKAQEEAEQQAAMLKQQREEVERMRIEQEKLRQQQVIVDKATGMPPEPVMPELDVPDAVEQPTHMIQHARSSSFGISPNPFTAAKPVLHTPQQPHIQVDPPPLPMLPNQSAAASPFAPQTTTSPFAPQTTASPFAPSTAASPFAPQTAASPFAPQTAASPFAPGSGFSPYMAPSKPHGEPSPFTQLENGLYRESLHGMSRVLPQMRDNSMSSKPPPNYVPEVVNSAPFVPSVVTSQPSNVVPVVPRTTTVKPNNTYATIGQSPNVPASPTRTQIAAPKPVCDSIEEALPLMKLRNEELMLYDAMYDQLCRMYREPHGLSGSSVFDLLMTSKIQKSTLAEIWALVSCKETKLNRVAFHALMRLIAIAQIGMVPTLSEFVKRLDTRVPLARVDMNSVIAKMRTVVPPVTAPMRTSLPSCAYHQPIPPYSSQAGYMQPSYQPPHVQPYPMGYQSYRY